MSTDAAPSVDIAGFVPTPNHILLSSEFAPETKLTYQIIRYHDRGRGCFACRETMAQEVGLSLYHLRRGICELVDHGIIKLEKRRMGLTDIIRLTDHDWGLPNPSEADLTEPEFELPPEPELPEEPLLPIQPVEVEVDLVEEPVKVAEEPIELATDLTDEPVRIEIAPDEDPIEVESAGEPAEVEVESDEEPVEDVVKPVEPGREDVSSRSSNDLNYKYDAFTKDASKYITPNTKLDRIDETGQTNQKSEWEELVHFFYQKKEGRKPTQNELLNWKPTATRMLSEFSLSELLSATQYAIEKGARLFYYVALVSPAYIIGQRQQKQEDVDRQKRDSKALQAEQQRRHQLESLRVSAAVYDAQTRSLLAGLENKMRPQVFRTWFKDAFIANITQDTLTLAVPSQGAVEWMSKSYTALIQEITDKPHIQFVTG